MYCFLALEMDDHGDMSRVTQYGVDKLTLPPFPSPVFILLPVQSSSGKALL